MVTLPLILFMIRNSVFLFLKENDPISICIALGFQVVNGKYIHINMVKMIIKTNSKETIKFILKKVR